MYQSYPMNRLNENITYLFSFCFISNMRIFLYYHTGPEKYPRNITPYKMITRSTIKTQSANCPKLATEFEKKKLLSPTQDSYPRSKDTWIKSDVLASYISDGFEGTKEQNWLHWARVQHDILIRTTRNMNISPGLIVMIGEAIMKKVLI